MRYNLLLALILLIGGSLACNYSQRLGTPTSNQPTAPLQTPGSILAPTLPSPTPSLTPEPTPTFTPTPPPEERIQQADQARFNGDWDKARFDYQIAVQDSQEPITQITAEIGLARTNIAAGELQAAIDGLEQLLISQPEDPQYAAAYFMLGEALSADGRYREAAEAYLKYLILRPGVIDAYVLNLRAESLVNAGDYAAALIDYRAALQSPSLLNQTEIEIKIAQSHAAVGDYGTAIGIYQDIYNRASSDFTKAQMDYAIGDAYLAMGQTEPAYQAFQDAVNNYPRANAAYQALLTLVDANESVSELQRGIVDYYAGQYGVALAAIDRYFQSGGVEVAKARYFNGLILRSLGEYQTAIGEWEIVIQNYPTDPYWDDAWEAKAYTQWAFLTDYPAAVNTLADFVAQAPANPRAAEFLFDAALIAELDDDLTQAGELWERVASEYPAAEQTRRALYLAGLARYRTADYPAALDLFQRNLASAIDPEDRAAAIFWQAKVQQAQGDLQGAQATFELAASTDPIGYYSERARDLLLGRLPFTPPETYDLGRDIERERQQAEQWLRDTFGLPTETDLSVPGKISADGYYIRAMELWQLGLQEEARAEFEQLRQSITDDPIANYQLAAHLSDLGLYRTAIFAARQVLNLAGMSDADTLNAPAFFNHIRFGVYFSDLVVPVAEEYNFHPLFLLSVIRQESAFEGFVRSSAGARGLMQIIPATGDEIARDLNWPPDYSADDLYRPVVSIRLGADYLDKWRSHFGGDLYATLAAYNGGPGNAIEWSELANGDIDIFVEVIRFEETRNYIRSIYEIFNLYRRIYNRSV